MEHKNNTNIKLLEYLKYPSPNLNGIQCNISSVKSDYPMHRHDFFEFEYIYSGSTSGLINGEPYTLDEGSFSFLGTKDFHNINPENSDVIFHNICFFVPKLPDNLRIRIQQLKLPMTGSFDDEGFIFAKKIFETMHKQINSPDEFSNDIVTSCVELIISYSSKFSNHTFKNSSNDHRLNYINTAVNYINNHFNEAISLDDAAKSANISSWYLSELFSDIMQCHFIEYINRVRIDNAKKLLKMTDMSITEIGYTCGFGSFSNFSRKFKDICNTSPSEYKKLNRS